MTKKKVPKKKTFDFEKAKDASDKAIREHFRNPGKAFIKNWLKKGM